MYSDSELLAYSIISKIDIKIPGRFFQDIARPGDTAEKIMKFITRIASFSFLLILPVGYYTGTKDSAHVTMGGGIGYGNYATLIQGCEGGQEVHMVGFRDFGGFVAVRPTIHSPFILGFQGGYLSVEEPPEPISANENYPYPYPKSNHAYVNPNISLELKPIGIGAGWLRNLGTVFPRNRWNVQDFDFRHSRDFPSGHIRIGPTDSWYGLASFCEGLPVMTQYGTILGGIGYGGLERKTIVFGVCGGLYEHAGLFGCMISKPGRFGGKSISFRIGRNLDTFEGSFSVGWYIPIK